VSDLGAYEEGVERISSLSDHEIDRLIGDAADGGGGFEELAAFVRGVETLYREEPDEATAARHLAAITGAAGRLVDDSSARTPGLRFATRRVRSGPNGRKRAGRVALAAGLVSLVAFGGAAYAGALPDPVQRTVSTIVGKVGLDVRGGDDAATRERRNGDDGDEPGEGGVGGGPRVDEPDPGADLGRARERQVGSAGDEVEGSGADEGAQGNEGEGGQNAGDQGEQEDGDVSGPVGDDQGDQDDQDDQDDSGGQDDADRGRHGGQGDQGSGGGPNEDGQDSSRGKGGPPAEHERATGVRSEAD
jgi:hypothetical protein